MFSSFFFLASKIAFFFVCPQRRGVGKTVLVLSSRAMRRFNPPPEQPARYYIDGRERPGARRCFIFKHAHPPPRFPQPRSFLSHLLVRVGFWSRGVVRAGRQFTGQSDELTSGRGLPYRPKNRELLQGVLGTCVLRCSEPEEVPEREPKM